MAEAVTAPAETVAEGVAVETADRARHSPPLATTSVRIRIVDATLDCLARQGTAKTTVEDVARQAGVSRATVYRVFPGGRDELLGAVVETEAARLFAAIGAELASAPDLSRALVAGIVEASTRIRDHAALRYLVDHEPGTVLGHLAFDEADRVLVSTSRFIAPFLTRWMSPLEGERVAEWATRVVLTYAISPCAGTDLTDRAQTSRLVETFMMPGIDALNSADRPSRSSTDCSVPEGRLA